MKQVMQTDASYREAINNKTRYTNIEFLIRFKDFTLKYKDGGSIKGCRFSAKGTDSAIKLNTFSIEYQCPRSNNVNIGAIYKSTLKMMIDPQELVQLDRYVAYDGGKKYFKGTIGDKLEFVSKDVIFDVSDLLNTDNVEYIFGINLGLETKNGIKKVDAPIYYPTEIKKVGKYYEITAQDQMCLLERPFNDLVSIDNPRVYPYGSVVFDESVSSGGTTGEDDGATIIGGWFSPYEMAETVCNRIYGNSYYVNKEEMDTRSPCFNAVRDESADLYSKRYGFRVEYGKNGIETYADVLRLSAILTGGFFISKSSSGTTTDDRGTTLALISSPNYKFFKTTVREAPEDNLVQIYTAEQDPQPITLNKTIAKKITKGQTLISFRGIKAKTPYGDAMYIDRSRPYGIVLDAGNIGFKVSNQCLVKNVFIDRNTRKRTASRAGDSLLFPNYIDDAQSTIFGDQQRWDYSGDILKQIYEKSLKDLTYYSCDIDFLGNPALDIGDVIKIIDEKESTMFSFAEYIGTKQRLDYDVKNYNDGTIPEDSEITVSVDGKELTKSDFYTRLSSDNSRRVVVFITGKVELPGKTITISARKNVKTVENRPFNCAIMSMAFKHHGGGKIKAEGGSKEMMRVETIKRQSIENTAQYRVEASKQGTKSNTTVRDNTAKSASETGIEPINNFGADKGFILNDAQLANGITIFEQRINTSGSYGGIGVRGLLKITTPRPTSNAKGTYKIQYKMDRYKRRAYKQDGTPDFNPDGTAKFDILTKQTVPSKDEDKTASLIWNTLDDFSTSVHVQGNGEEVVIPIAIYVRNMDRNIVDGTFSIVLTAEKDDQYSKMDAMIKEDGLKVIIEGDTLL